MPQSGDLPRAAFVARQFESPALKSWKEADAQALRQALGAAIDLLRGDRPVIIDLLIDIEAVALEPHLAAANVVHWRSRPSMGFGARARRLLGFYSGESTLAAAVQAETGAQAVDLMPRETLWDCEFTIYPPPDRPVGELPDPHFHVPGFCGHVRWAVMQDSSDSWLLTAVDEATLAKVCQVLTASFEAAGLTTSLAPGPVFEAAEPAPEAT